ncbi:serine/threonine-protein kinase 32A [Capsaspora owczarzaki ATCC 30864]|uniref:AGC/YANK protein kinase n=1 Tax=Capsaspora owczarzaki (strain ATCC 30864) TaxID=595528 RepID=A0A0D2WJG0_CAPO3|nr:serine/threonine-protein kinase 32A [Capsaspora owczarzaki ATCC 30864]KJE90165.1 AGC/YANK protein kinase [Capsaspora owczarzaki ATCC 30864]|eukprot:XP_004364379.2 serine/threonine-protein kinase 32A [Capsaspora owczarzaki ATCC 30864]
MGCIASKPPIDFSADVNFEHFKLLRSVGRGAFGKVCIVLKRDTKKLYAMKYMNKEKCLQKRAIRNVFNERKILESLQHQFIVNLWFAFQDEEDLFFVVDLMLGGDLRYHAQRSGAFSEDRIRLYTAELMMALVYIHDRNIIHRDIKPDNILMDENGHVHLADFNVAASIRKGSLLYARAGTKPYMAPEILNKSGYNQSADWWSLGVCMYELLRGKHPFRGGTTEEMLEMIQSAPIKYPTTWSEPCISFLSGLLERDVTKRMTITSENVQEVLKHPFLASLDYDKLINKELVPSFVPDKDKVNCDAMYELEEMMLEDNPLHKKKQRLQKTTMSKQEQAKRETIGAELQRIAEKFTVYDRSKVKSTPDVALDTNIDDDEITSASPRPQRASGLAVFSNEHDSSHMSEDENALRGDSDSRRVRSQSTDPDPLELPTRLVTPVVDDGSSTSSPIQA